MNDDNHGMKTGDIVTFKDIDGMTELNGIECEIIGWTFDNLWDPIMSFYNLVESKSVIKLKIDTSNMSKYTKNGICIQMPTKKTLHFVSIDIFF